MSDTSNRAPKRNLEDTITEGQAGEEGRDKKTKLADDPETFEVRVLIQSVQVGTVIGKRGSNITRVREECNVFASILKAPEGVRERILTVKGHTDSIALALHRFGELLAESQRQRAEKQGENTTDAKNDAFKVQFLVHASLVGGVIGKGGSLVQETQSSTGARVQVSTEALAQSTEKTITISGELNNVYAATQIVIGQLKENQLRPGVQNYPYSPSPPYGGAGGRGGYGGPPAHGHYQQQAPSPYGAPPQQQASYGGYQGYAPSQYAPVPAPHSSYGAPQQQQSYGAPQQSSSGSLDKQMIVIPTVCAGNVIGRGGSIITNIKQQSGTFISIAPAEQATPHERMVTISGNPQGIQTAVFLIRQIVDQFEARQPAQGGYQ